MAKLADALDLGSSASRHGGSSPSVRTITSVVVNLELVRDQAMILIVKDRPSQLGKNF